MTARRYRHPRYHYPRLDGSYCPDPGNCVCTGQVEGDCCECCGQVIAVNALDALVAAMGAVTAVDSEGFVVCEYDAEDNPLSGCPATVVLARQLAQALRWMAAHCPSTNEDGGTEDGLWFHTDLDELADRAEAVADA